jgi:hypothetical protein
MPLSGGPDWDRTRSLRRPARAAWARFIARTTRLLVLEHRFDWLLKIL